jgi:esterase/lipase superfamily enzyme
MIQEKGVVHCKVFFNGRLSGKIYYTRPYDYLKETDRNEILEFMFWLGLHSLPSGYRPK